MNTITIGNNFSPPVVCMETAKDIYEQVKSDEFEIAKFNALLMSIVTYLDKHGVEYADKELPWAELIEET